MWKALCELPSVKAKLDGAEKRLGEIKCIRSRALRLSDRLYDLNRSFEGKPWIDGRPMRNFRRVWSSEEFFSLFETIFPSQQLFDRILRVPDPREPHVMPLDANALDELLIKAKHTLGRCREQVDNARGAFHSTSVRAFDHAGEVLTNLALLGIEHYAVTEGDDDNQKWKWRNSLLVRHIQEQAVLTSWRAGQSTLDLPAFAELLKDLRVELRFKSGPEWDHSNAEVVGLEGIRTFVEDLMDKSKHDFYAIVLRAVMAFPKHARDLLRLVRLPPEFFGSARAERHEVKAVMVGDTYDKDILPIRLLDANVGTVLATMLAERFKEQKKKLKVRKLLKSNRPDFIMSSLVMIQDHLAEGTYWQKARRVNAANLKFRDLAEPLTSATIESFLSARRSSVWGVRPVVDQLFEVNSHQVGLKSMLRMLLQIASDSRKELAIRTSALEALGEMELGVLDEGVLKEGLDQVLTSLPDSADRDLLGELLRPLLSVAGKSGGLEVLRWLLVCFNDEVRYIKLRVCLDEALAAHARYELTMPAAACAAIARRLPKKSRGSHSRAGGSRTRRKP